MNLNKVFILGNLTRDPEKRSLPSGQTVVSFGVATNRFFTNQNNERQQETEFHNITAFGKLAEIAYQYLKKGSLVFIEGRLRTRNWEDSGGIKHFRTEIIAEKLQLGPKTDNSSVAKKGTPSSSNEAVSVSEEEIPVIDQDAPVQETNNAQENNKNEIDVRDIPF